jgi:thermitase
MAGKSRCARRTRRSTAPRFENLETRTLLSVDPLSGSDAIQLDRFTSVLVRFEAGASSTATATAIAAVEGRVVESFPDGPSVVEIPVAVDVSAALVRLNADPAVVYAEPDAAIQSEAFPSDTYYSSQWGLNNDGNDVDIDAPQAWSITTGNPGIIVAVLDTGIDLGNPDLTSRLWTNPTAGRDGYSGDLHGYNFVNRTGNVQDNNGHGSHVTGILASAGNNGNGIAGVDWNARIMPLKVLDADGGGSIQDAVNAIYFAADHGARVINASWGGGESSQAMRDAINYAGSKGAVFVTAAGNEKLNNDASSSYPASYRLPNELVVAAIDSAGNLASFSNYGARTVDLAAPGVNIWSTITGGYASYSGTSMATPYVSGVVSLLAGLHPELDAAQLVLRVRDTAKKLGSLDGKVISGGMVDAYNALNFSEAPQAQTLGSGGTGLAAVEGAILATDDTFRSYGGTATGYVTGLFRSIFGRDPDPAGLAYYAGQISSGVARSDVIHELQSFDEANRTKVARWYIDELGWSLPLGGMKANDGVIYWAGLLDGGRSEDVVHAQILSHGIKPGGSSADYVAGLFQAVLGRAPDANAAAFYAGQIDQGGDGSRFDVAEQLLTSFEARRTTIARLYQVELGWAAPLVDLKVNEGVWYWAVLIGGW